MNLIELLGQEQASKIAAIAQEKGVDIILDNKEKPEYVQKTKLDEVSGQKDQIKAQAEELNQQLETLKKSAKGNEELTNKIEELQTKNSEWENKYKGNIIDSSIKMSALKANAKDPSDIMAFIDKSKLQLDENGTVTGLEEQLKVLSESKTYLFGEVVPGAGGTNPPSGGDLNSNLNSLDAAIGAFYKK